VGSSLEVISRMHSENNGRIRELNVEVNGKL